MKGDFLGLICLSMEKLICKVVFYVFAERRSGFRKMLIKFSLLIRPIEVLFVRSKVKSMNELNSVKINMGAMQLV